MSNEFYISTGRIGCVCSINGKDVYTLFDADLKSMEFTHCPIESTYRKKAGNSSLEKINIDYGIGRLTMLFYVGGKSNKDAYINTGKLLAECENCVITVDGDEFEYAAIIDGTPDVKETGIPFYNEVSITFAYVKRYPLVLLEFNNTAFSFTNPGLTVSGMRIKVIPSKAYESLTVAGITVKGLIANQIFIIDGIEGKVECLGVNRFIDTNLIEFPKAMPGVNEITVSENVSVVIEYYPTFNI